jgi:hypothetical protein
MRSALAIILDHDMTILVISNSIGKHKYHKIVDFTIPGHIFGDNIFCKLLFIILLQIFNKKSCRSQELFFISFSILLDLPFEIFTYPD